MHRTESGPGVSDASWAGTLSQASQAPPACDFGRGQDRCAPGAAGRTSGLRGTQRWASPLYQQLPPCGRASQVFLALAPAALLSPALLPPKCPPRRRMAASGVAHGARAQLGLCPAGNNSTLRTNGTGPRSSGPPPPPATGRPSRCSHRGKCADSRGDFVNRKIHRSSNFQ